MGDETRKAKRRLLDIVVEEVSVVDKPAIGRKFVLIKRNNGDLEKNAMGIGGKIKLAREKKGMTVEQLAEATGIETDSLNKAESGEHDLTEEDIAKIAGALDVEKFDPEEEEDPEAAAAAAGDKEKVEDEGAMPAEGEGEESEDSSDTSMHMKLLTEKLTMISEAAQELLGSLPQKSVDDVQKALRGISSVIWSVSETAEVAMLTKRADEKIAVAKSKTDVLEIMDDLAKAMKVAFTEASEDDRKAEKVEKKAKADKTDDDKDVSALKKEVEALRKKVSEFEKQGVSKSLPDDDESSKVEKKSDGPSWGFLSKDIPG